MEFGFFQSGICKNLKWKITAPMYDPGSAVFPENTYFATLQNGSSEYVNSLTSSKKLVSCN